VCVRRATFRHGFSSCPRAILDKEQRPRASTTCTYRTAVNAHSSAHTDSSFRFGRTNLNVSPGENETPNAQVEGEAIGCILWLRRWRSLSNIIRHGARCCFSLASSLRDFNSYCLSRPSSWAVSGFSWLGTTLFDSIAQHHYCKQLSIPLSTAVAPK
jgi:hypothetical protein